MEFIISFGFYKVIEMHAFKFIDKILTVYAVYIRSKHTTCLYNTVVWTTIKYHLHHINTTLLHYFTILDSALQPFCCFENLSPLENRLAMTNIIFFSSYLSPSLNKKVK